MIKQKSSAVSSATEGRCTVNVMKITTYDYDLIKILGNFLDCIMFMFMFFNTTQLLAAGLRHDTHITPHWKGKWWAANEDEPLQYEVYF